MNPKQQESLEHLRQMAKTFSESIAAYRQEFSDERTWGFWVCLALLVLPFLLLFRFLDRKKALHIGFFGLNAHVWFLYIDSLGADHGRSSEKGSLRYFDLCAVFAFIFKLFMSLIDLFLLFEWMNFFYLFLAYMIIMLLSLWLTRLFVNLQEQLLQIRNKMPALSIATVY